MKSMINLALLVPALMSSPVAGQPVPLGGVTVQPQATKLPLVQLVTVQPRTTKLPLVPQQLEGFAMATRDLRITHVSPAGTELGVEPAGLMFASAPRGPACPHWPANGCGVKYSIEEAANGFAYTYTGRELIQLAPREVGETGLHDNLIQVKAPVAVPVMVDVRIASVVDAPFSYQMAEVVLTGFGAVRHEFRAGRAETTKTLQAQVDPFGLQIHAWTQLFADNSSQPSRAALMDLEVQVTVRLPVAGYSVGENTCVGSNGVPFLFPSGYDLPVVGETFTVSAWNLPVAVSRPPLLPAFGLIGGTRMLPFDLGPFGMPNCYLHISQPLAIPLESCCGTLVWELPIPANLSLVGAEFVQQVFAVDESWVNPLGCVITNYGQGTIGAPPAVL